MEKTLSQHIENNKNEIDRADISAQRRRHLSSELSELENYKKNHPNDEHDPTPLELFCDENPDASECRIYED